MTCRRTACLAAGLAAALAAGCRGDGNVSLFGYTTAPPFDPDVRSVYVPVFKVAPFHTNPYRGWVEYDLTQAVVDEINTRRTPMRVASDPAKADTELVGTIVELNKWPLNRNLQNQNREFDVQIGVQVVWRDLRTGRVLSGTRPPAPPPADRFDPSAPAPPPPGPDPGAVPYFISASSRALPELGESNYTAEVLACKRLARQIVNMMENPW